MSYVSVWEKLSDTLTRVMETNGSTRNDAQVDICRAIADSAVKIQAKPLRSMYGRTASPGTVLKGENFRILSLKPEDFDWQGSRPLKRWLVLRGAPVRHVHWDIEWIELLKEDVTNVLCAPSKGGEPAQPPPREIGARSRSRPDRERAQDAIKALYPDGVPGQAAEPNKILCRRIAKWLRDNDHRPVSDETVLRAAGRRK